MLQMKRHLASRGSAAVARAFLRPRSGDLHRCLGVAASGFHDPRGRRHQTAVQTSAAGGWGSPVLGFRRPPGLCPAGGPLGAGLAQRRTFLFSDVSIFEVGVVLVVASAFVNRKDVPELARAAGKLIGVAVGQLIRAKQALSSVGDVSDLVKMRRELQEGVRELRTIRHDIYGFGTPNLPLNPQTGQHPTQWAGKPSAGGAQSSTPVSLSPASSVPLSRTVLPPIGATSAGSDIMQQVGSVAWAGLAARANVL
jgi:hypothetical protein